REKTVLLARATEERAKTDIFRTRGSQRVPLGGGSCLRRTGHPFTVSSPVGPSQKIEFVFSASPETIRGSLGSLISFAQSATCGTWQSAHRGILLIFFPRSGGLSRRP